MHATTRKCIGKLETMLLQANMKYRNTHTNRNTKSDKKATKDMKSGLAQKKLQ